MAGIALLLDLLRKNPSWSPMQSLHSHGLFSATIAASAAAASDAAGTPFAPRVLFSNGISVSYCDGAAVGADWREDYMSNIRSASGNIFQHESLEYSSKEYIIELKPLFSAFGLKNFAVTSLGHLLTFYLRPLARRTEMGEDDDYLVKLSKDSMKEITFETAVETTRRVLERLAVQYVPQRMAWKLLKDVRKSAMRKAERGMPSFVYFVSVSRTTFRGELLGVVAKWLVQVGLEIYFYPSCMFNSCMSNSKKDEPVDKEEKAWFLGKLEKARILGKIFLRVSILSGASLVLASIGAGIGATLLRPSLGHWIGWDIGNFAGYVVGIICFVKFFT